MANYQLYEKIFIQAELKTLSGLLIGGSDAGLSIGGIDKTVIIDPATKQPYIPGSSLKGKIRSLLELAEGKLGGKGGSLVKYGACMDPNSHGAILCGNAIDKAMGEKLGVSADLQRPSPLMVRDSYLKAGQDFRYANLGFTHTKTEVSIDRITAKANPRTIERVPPGAIFEIQFVLNIFQDEGMDAEKRAQKTKKLMDLLFKGLVLLQDDYLGGFGSRGSGQVDFKIKEIFSRDMAWYQALERDEKGNDCAARFVIPQNLKSHA